MKSTHLTISQALISFLAYGSAFSPQRNTIDLSESEIQGIERILRTMSSHAIDWSLHSLVSAGKLVRTKMAGEMPGLSETALDALEWKFTFDWR